MKNKFLINSLFIISLFILSAGAVFAAPTISDIKQGNMEENKMEISWITSQPTTGYVVFGKTSDDMPFYVGDSVLSRTHTVDLTGLKKGQNYFFKIFSTDENGAKAESFVNFIDTEDMPDTRSAIISDLKKLQSTDTAFAISFKTDEPTKTEVKYGTAADALTKSWKDGSLKAEHTVIITGLKASTKYYYEILAKDKDDNLSSSGGEVTTASQGSGSLKVSKLSPESYNQAPLMAENAIISWESNILATSDIVYGTEPKKLNKSTKISTTSTLVHRAVLSKLEPNTVYYYQIKMKNALDSKTFTSQVYSFKTAPMDAQYLSFYFKDGELVKYKNTTYFIYNGTKTAINNSDKIKSISSATPRVIEEKYGKAFKDGTPYWGVFHDGELVKEAKNSTIYLIDGNLKRPIAKWEILRYLNYEASDIVIAKPGRLNSYKLGTIIKHSKEVTSSKLNNTLVKSPSSSSVYLVANGKKMPFFSQQAFLRYGYSFHEVKKISDKELGGIPTGQIIM